MAARRLSAEERALWAKVTASVRPIAEVTGNPASSPFVSSEVETPASSLEQRLSTSLETNGKGRRVAKSGPPSRPGETLDGGWDRRLARGLVQPDLTIDLHGHTLVAAHAALEAALARAVADGMRVMLVVTGNPPRGPAGHGPPRRGAIRAAIGDWLAISPHATRIAAIRHASPRHGGAGALYVVMRRMRG